MSIFKYVTNRFYLKSEYVKWLLNHSLPYMPKLGLLMVIGMISSSISIFLAIVTKEVIDSAMEGVLNRQSIFIYIAMICVTITISSITTLVGVTLDENFSFGIRKQLYSKIIESSWLDVSSYHTGDLMTRLTSDAENIAEGIIYTLPNILNLLLQMLLTFGILFYYDPIIAIFSLMIGPIAALISFIIGRRLKKLQIKVQETEASYRSFLQESLSHLLVVKAFSREKAFLDKLSYLRGENFHWIKELTKLGVVSSSIMSLTFQIGYIAAFAFGSTQVATGVITFGTMTVFLTLVNRIQGPIFELAGSIPQVVSMLASVERVIELQSIKLESYEPSKLEQSSMGIELSNIIFAYEGNNFLFDGTSTTIDSGDFVAILGESGIGKTTLVRLIMSFFNPNSGQIKFIDELGNTEESSASSREYIAYVPQGNTLFSGSIKENIQIGNVLADDQEIQHALKLSAADDFVMDLPQGIDTYIGEGGFGISEGQAQRIAIARALVKNSPILILDEATSALDEQTETRLLESLSKNVNKPTCLMITHRKSILKYCDKELNISKRKINLRELSL